MLTPEKPMQPTKPVQSHSQTETKLKQHIHDSTKTPVFICVCKLGSLTVATFMSRDPLDDVMRALNLPPGDYDKGVARGPYRWHIYQNPVSI